MSTRLSIEDYNAFVILTRVEYEAILKEESASELIRFTIRCILNPARSQPEYQILQQQQEKQSQNNQQQQIHRQVILPSTTSSCSHQHQVPNDISRTNNLVSQKMTPWKLSSLL